MHTILYHLTDLENLPDILKAGLKPMVGKNSHITGDDTPMIYMSNEKSLPYWQAILGKTACVRITVTDTFALRYFMPPNRHRGTYQSGLYTEIRTAHMIPPECISVCAPGHVPPRVCDDLWTGYVHDASFLVLRIVKAMDYSISDLDKSNMAATEQYLAFETKTLTDIMERITARSALNTDTAVKILSNLGEDGEYTMCDMYCNTDNRLWQMLLLHPSTILRDERKRLYGFLTEHMSGVLHTNTGGYENSYASQ